MGLFTKKTEKQKEWEKQQADCLGKFNAELDFIIKSNSYDDVVGHIIEASTALKNYAWGRLNEANPDKEKELKKKTYKGVALARQLFPTNFTPSENNATLCIQRYIYISTAGGNTTSKLSLKKMYKASENALYLFLKKAYGDQNKEKENESKFKLKFDNDCLEIKKEKNKQELQGWRKNMRDARILFSNAAHSGMLCKLIQKIKPELKNKGKQATVDTVNALLDNYIVRLVKE